MFHRLAGVVDRIQLADRTHRIRFDCPDVAGAIRPGQFVMLRIPGTSDPLLGRPFALYDTVLDDVGRPIAIDVVYLVVGKLTGLLTNLSPGNGVEIWGPLGRPYLKVDDTEHVRLVAGGIGQTPFLAYARELLGNRGYGGDRPRKRANRVSLYYGVRTASLAAGIADFLAVGTEVHQASDDGSIGHAGSVIHLLEAHGLGGPIVGCGPKPMLHALAKLAATWDVPCHVSLETPMACGVGICFSCVTKVKLADGGWDYKRVCLDGPTFDAAGLDWE